MGCSIREHHEQRDYSWYSTWLWVKRLTRIIGCIIGIAGSLMGFAIFMLIAELFGFIEGMR